LNHGDHLVAGDAGSGGWPPSRSETTMTPTGYPAAFGVGGGQSGNSDDPALGVDESAAAVGGVDGGAGLDGVGQDDGPPWAAVFASSWEYELRRAARLHPTA
jgi:hypothetical protein